MNRAPHSESARQIVHISMGAFALLLRWTAWWQAMALAGGALLFNVFVLPHVAGRLYRPGDRGAGLHGIVYYPISVLALLLLFPHRLDSVAAAWGILAAGDGAATLAGRAIGGARWPWNRDKTVAGSVAFFVAGTAMGVGLALWCRPVATVPMAFAAFAVPVAALAAAFVETIPIKLDDNLSVSLSAGGVLWLGAMVVARRVDYHHGDFFEDEYVAVALPNLRVALALAANALVAVAGYAGRSVSIAGAICGAIIGIAIFVSLGWQGWLLLLLTFVAASVASRLGLARKQRLGIDEDRGGRRGPGNAIANTGAAAIAALLAGLDVHPEAARLAFVAALATAGSDTIASEIGKAYGRRTFSIRSFSRVVPGTSGAMSLEGTAAGVLGALGLGAAAAAIGLIPLSELAAVVVGASVGALVESWLGATLEEPGILNNDVLNFINSTVGIAVTLAVSQGLR
ncbi:MAG TPA: DUF92 domain-containing protein [Vicinamibacterales bacterium]